MWLKKGNIHDDAREEIEVFVDNKYESSLTKMLSCLGYEVEIKWFRKRLMGEYKGITLTIDYTAGYGYIIELENLIKDESKIESTKEELLKIFNDLDIKVSLKQEFKDKYEDYKMNWNIYTKDIDEKEFLK
jgi:adenylate cyclase class IV